MLDFVKKQEAAKGFIATATEVPEDHKNGLTHQIGYGHSISKNSPLFGRTITEKEASDLLLSDLLKAQGIARKFFDGHYGSGKFDKLSQSQRELLTDFAYNNALYDFPKMMKAVANGDYETAT